MALEEAPQRANATMLPPFGLQFNKHQIGCPFGCFKNETGLILNVRRPAINAKSFRRKRRACL